LPDDAKPRAEAQTSLALILSGHPFCYSLERGGTIWQFLAVQTLELFGAFMNYLGVEL